MSGPSKIDKQAHAAQQLARVAELDGERDILPYIGKFMPNVVVTAFEAAGGQDRFNQWAEENYSDFAKTFLAKMLPRQVAISPAAATGIEDALAELERRTIDVEATEIDKDGSSA